jgi:hypothetical protein
MISGRIILRLLLGLAAVVIVGLTTVYVLASWRPGYFRPAYLTQREKEIATHNFTAKITQLTNQVQAHEPYVLSMTQDEANTYLASTDEIALFLHPGQQQRGDIQQLMDRVGLAEPCVRFENGVVTLMIRSAEYGKIFSVDLSFSFDGDGSIRIHLERARIGLFPIPRFMVRTQLERLKVVLRERLEAAQAERAAASEEGQEVGGFAVVDLTEIFAKVITAVDENPIRGEIRVRGQYAQISNIEIEGGSIAIHFEPVDIEPDDDDEN